MNIGRLLLLISISLFFGKKMYGQSVIRNYDLLGRITYELYPDSSSITYTYDENGNLKSKKEHDPCSTKPRPVTTVTGLTTFCVGESTALSVNSPGIKFRWSTGDTVHTSITVMVGGDYTISRLDSFVTVNGDTIQCYLTSDTVHVTIQETFCRLL
jgi:YD repeat-containing protein